MNSTTNKNHTYNSTAVNFRSVCDNQNNNTLRRKHTRKSPDHGIGKDFLNRRTKKMPIIKELKKKSK